MDVTLHVLHDHDRVVDDDPDREDHAEERERVEREAEQQHDREGPDKGDRHGYERNDRRPPRLEEDHHHHDHEQDGDEERLDDRTNRLADEDRRVVHDAVVHALGERLLQPLHRGANLIGGLDRVRPRPLEDADRHCGLVVEQAPQRVLVRTELHPADVTNPRDLAFLSGAHDDVGELILCLQTPPRVDRKLEGRIAR